MNGSTEEERRGRSGRRGGIGAMLGVLAAAACGGDAPRPEALPEGGAAGPPELPAPFVRGTADTRPAYPDARITVEGPERIAPGETLEVRISASGWAPAVPTEGGEARGLARAPMGQHVHLVPNGEPYVAIYDLDAPHRIADLPAGTHRLLFFASRDWHESVKSPGAWAELHVQVGDAAGEGTPPAGVPRVAPSRPKGEYAAAEADSILVDVYVTGTTLSESGSRVRFTLNDGPPAEMTEWAPWYLVGVPAGSHRLRVELLDASGAVIGGAWNVHETTFTVLP